MRSTRSGAMTLFFGVGLALAGLIALGATITNTSAQAQGLIPPEQGLTPEDEQDAAWAADLDPEEFKRFVKTYGLERPKGEFQKGFEDEFRKKPEVDPKDVVPKDVVPIAGDSNEPPKSPKPPEKEEHVVEKARSIKELPPGVAPIAGDSHGPVDKVDLHIKDLKKTQIDAHAPTVGDQPAIGAKSSNQSKIGGVSAPKPTAPRQQFDSADSKPPAFLANAKSTASRQQFDSADSKPPAFLANAKPTAPRQQFNSANSKPPAFLAAPKPTAPRPQIGSANSKPPAFLAAPKPATPSFATPAARAGVR